MAERINSIDEISETLNAEVNDLVAWSSDLDDGMFFKSVNEKWSTGEQIEHLRKSSSPLAMALKLPKIVIKAKVGKPNRPSRSYEEVKEKYRVKLAALDEIPTTRFYPDIQKDKSKKKILDSYLSTSEKLIKAVRKWQDEDLDRYILPHPLLGKLTVREMLFFTINHTRHHFNSIKQLYG